MGYSPWGRKELDTSEEVRCSSSNRITTACLWPVCCQHLGGGVGGAPAPSAPGTAPKADPGRGVLQIPPTSRTQASPKSCC